ncbi:MAG: hypothetical protein [Xiangshan rhabdo-like virus 4]|uniref:Uncharacterized protein n=1 Tax=Xiangshan rhabdo-like virus 4 TaxID=2886227 RepID=A0A8K1P3I9_9RHAB|nr:MAG: hypothetical protein [Xiangshan rhabdo-like virus 4]
MEGFGQKISLPGMLVEEFVPSHSGFISTQSEIDSSNDLDEQFDPSGPDNPDDSSTTTSSKNNKGIGFLDHEFQHLKRNLIAVMQAQKEEQSALVVNLTGKLINNGRFSKVVEYYNIHSHLIHPNHFLKMILDLGEKPSSDDVNKWYWILTGIIMEKQLTKDEEIEKLKDLCRKTCEDIQRLTLDTNDSLSQFTVVINESKQVQMATHDTLIQFQEIINDKTIPTLPSSTRQPTLEYRKQWVLPPIKILWEQGTVRVKSGKIDPELLEATRGVASILKSFSLQELQKLNSITYDQLLGVFSVMNNKQDKDELKSLLASFT